MSIMYYDPTTLPELFAVVNECNHYSVLAGGTDLLVKLKEKMIAPQAIIDINRITELQGIEQQSGRLSIGALVTHFELLTSPVIRQRATALAEAASQVGSPQIRNIATVGGNIGNASPAADTVPALLVLDAMVEVASAQTRVEKPLDEVLCGPGKTCLKTGEIISRIRVAGTGKNEGTSFLKIGKRKALAIAIINGAARIKIEQGKIADVRLALGSVAPTAIRLHEIEQWLTGKCPDADVLKTAGAMAEKLVKPIDDVRAKAVYRIDLTGRVVSRCLDMAVQRAQEVCHCG